MNKRPLSITVISWLFIAVGTIAFLYHVREAWHAFEPGLVWICLVRLLAILSGVLMLFAFNCGRWLLAIWIGFHVLLSVFHSASELFVHALLFVVVVYFLFRPRASAYFRGKGAEPPRTPKLDDRPVT